LWHTFGKVITGGDPYADYSDGEFREAVRTVELDADPGTEFEYSNFAVGLLGYVLASKSGSDYETYIKAQVCEPLGMHDTGSTLSKDQAARFVQGYATMSTLARWLQYHRSTPWNIPNSLAGCGALRSSANDMLIYLKANMRPSGELAGAIRRSHHELYRGKEGPVIAMNWFRAWNTTLKKVIIWHNGETGGYHSYIGFTEDGSAGVVILANVADAKVEALAEKILVDVATSAVR
jgi:CubicO group peptidase (beta-lactamase class C family)